MKLKYENMWGDWLPALMEEHMKDPVFRAIVARRNNWLDDELFENNEDKDDT